MRSLRQSPGFLAAAVATLGGGIAATVTMFSVYSSVVLDPVAVADPASLVSIYGINPHLLGSGAMPISWPRFQELRAQSTSYVSLAAYSSDTVTLTAAGVPAEQLRALRVSEEFFATLRIGAARGRLFTADDDRPNGPAVCLLTHELWQARFAGQAMVGSAIQLDGRSVEVLGILPPRLSPPWANRQIVLPRVFDDSGIPPASVANGATFVDVVARLRPGVSQREAREELRRMTLDYSRRFAAKSDAANDTAIRPLAAAVSEGRRPILRALLGAVVLVLLVSCANGSALVLGRLAGRQREIAVKQALGARRAIIVWDGLRESLACSIVASVAGVAIAAAVLPVLQAELAAALPPGVMLRLNGWSLVLTAAVALICAVLIGLAPALHVTRRGSAPVMVFARGMSESRATRRFRHGLVVCEVGLSVLLLVGTGLALDSLRRLHRASPGFDPSGVAAGYVALPASTYDSPQQQGAFFIEVVERLAATPAITAAAVVFGLPFDDNYAAPYAIGGRLLPTTAERPRAGLRIVSEDYLRVMRIRLAAGRPFTSADRPGAPNVCLVNQTLARRQFGGDAAAVGRTLLRGRNADPYEIVGVVADVKTNGLTTPTPEEVFYAFRQSPRPNATLVARTNVDPELLAPLMQSAVSAVNRSQPLFGFATMSRRLASTLGPQRMLAGLTIAFSLTALLLAAGGLAAVLMHNVAQRRMEIGIRQAIGADRRAIVRLVVGEGLGLVGAGVAVGVLAAALVSRAVATQLFEVDPYNPALYLGVAILFAAIGAAASLGPAVRASRIAPAVSLGGS